MRESKRKLSVISEHEQAARVGIETADREEPVPGESLLTDRVQNSRARSFVFRGRDHTHRLVEHEIAMLRARLDDPAVDGDRVIVRVDEQPRRWWDLAVHAHRAGGDQLICAPPAGDA